MCVCACVCVCVCVCVSECINYLTNKSLIKLIQIKFIMPAKGKVNRSYTATILLI